MSELAEFEFTFIIHQLCLLSNDSVTFLFYSKTFKPSGRTSLSRMWLREKKKSEDSIRQILVWSTPRIKKYLFKMYSKRSLLWKGTERQNEAEQSRLVNQSEDSIRRILVWSTPTMQKYLFKIYLKLSLLWKGTERQNEAEQSRLVNQSVIKS